jgi:hypothetical protein
MNGCFYDKHIKELENDIDEFLRNIGPNDVGGGGGGRRGILSPLDLIDSEGMGIKPIRKGKWAFITLNEKWGKRLSWIASKLALLGINMLQYEWHRRQSIYNSEKRLSEIPEFPIL